MTARPRSRATDRIGDVLGVGAAVVGTIALHLFLFGGDQYFSLRFLLSPVDNPISFTAFVLTLVLLVVALVRASRVHAWRVLGGADAETLTSAETEASRDVLSESDQVELRGDSDTGGALTDSGTRGERSDQRAVQRPLAAVAVPGAVTRRALRTAAITAVLNALFMIVFPIAIILMFAVIFLIAAALIASAYIVLRAVSVGENVS